MAAQVSRRNQSGKLKLRARRVKTNPGHAGAPTAYTPRTVRLLCNAYAEGVSLKDAAAAAGISYRTVFAWREESEKDPDGPKGDFCKLLEEALSRAIVQSARDKRRADPGWWLSRMRPKRFGDPTKKVEVAVGTTAAGDDAIKFAKELLTNDEAREHIEAAGRLLFAAAGQSRDDGSGAEPGQVEE